MRDSKNILYTKLGVSPMERQYGGGLDNVYMNRRRSSAFADPDATSAFTSPMSMGGLPTVYRQDPGQVGDGMDDDYTGDELTDIGGSGISIEDVSFEDPYGPTGEDDWTTAKAQAQLGAMRGPSKTMQELEEDKELGYSPVELANIYQSQGDKENASRVINESILSNTARNALMSALYGKVGGQGGWDGVENFIANMSPEALANFNTAASGSSFFGDIGGDDPSKGYRFGGPEGTLQDILEKDTEAELGLKDFFEGLKKPKEEKGIKGLIAKGIDMVSLTKNMTPENIKSFNNMLENKNFVFTPNNKFAAGAVSFAAPTIGKAAISLLGGEKTVGTITNKETGTSYQVGDRGGLTLNMPDPTIDYGSDAEIKEEEIVTEKIPEKAKEESSMDKNISLNKKSRVDPNIQIIMDIYGLTFEEANKFLGNEGVGTGGAGEFEGT